MPIVAATADKLDRLALQRSVSEIGKK